MGAATTTDARDDGDNEDGAPPTSSAEVGRGNRATSGAGRDGGSGGAATNSAAICYAGSSPSGRTRIGRIGSINPFNATLSRTTVAETVGGPREMGDSGLASTSPALACAQSRAARSNAPPRKPSGPWTASPASMPIPTVSGRWGRRQSRRRSVAAGQPRAASTAAASRTRRAPRRTEARRPTRRSQQRGPGRSSRTRSELRRRLVAAPLGELRVSADIGEQERQQLGRLDRQSDRPFTALKNAFDKAFAASSDRPGDMPQVWTKRELRYRSSPAVGGNLSDLFSRPPAPARPGTEHVSSGPQSHRFSWSSLSQDRLLVVAVRERNEDCEGARRESTPTSQ